MTSKQSDIVNHLDQLDQGLRVRRQVLRGNADAEISRLQSDLVSRGVKPLVPLGNRFSYNDSVQAERFINELSELQDSSLTRNAIAIADLQTRPLNGEIVAVLSSGAVGIRPAKVVVYYDSELVDMLCSDDPLVADLAYRALSIPTLPICSAVPHSRFNGEPCKKPGKVPHLRKWTRRYVDPPMARRQLLSLVSRNPELYGGGIGAPLRRGELLLEFDVKSGGLESLHRLEEALGKLPVTPTAKSGGGGYHYRFLIPPNLKLVSGGSLEAIGYPGAEFKAFGGQEVLPPTLHASGKRYKWEPGRTPAEVPTRPLPGSYLALLLDVALASSQSRKRAIEEIRSTGAKAARERQHRHFDYVAAFRATYSEGSRRVATGLPRLAGVLASHGVSVQEGTDFLMEWQKSHFAPPLEDSELESQLRSMWERWGHLPDPCRSSRFLARLRREMRDPNPTQSSATTQRPNSGSSAGSELARARMKTLFELRRQYRSGVDLNPHDMGMQVDGLPILIEDPALYPTKDEISTAIRDMPPTRAIPATRLELIETCGLDLSGRCDQHGERTRARKTCKLPEHAGCPTQATQRVRTLELPAPEPGGSYRAAWLEIPVNLGADRESWSEAVSETCKVWAKAFTKVARRRAGSVLMARSISFGMSRTDAVAYLKVLLYESSQGESDETFRQLCEETGSRFAREKRIPTAELAVLQLVSDTMTHLHHLETGDPELYAAWYNGIRGKRLFQPVHRLYGGMKQEWCAGEAEITPDASSVTVTHRSGKDIKIQARPKAAGSRWATSGADFGGWQIEAVVGAAFTIRIGRSSDQPRHFLWRLRAEHVPRCDLCDEPLRFYLDPPERPT